MGLSQIPNLLTIARIILTLPIVFYLLKEQYLFALILIIGAGISDGLDGFLAKRFNWQSRLGSVLDPLADKMLLIGCFITLFWLSLIPDWLMYAVVIRDVMIVAGTVGYSYAIGSGQQLLKPSNLSKINTALQIFLVLLVILAQLIVIDPMWLLAGWFVVFTSTVLSGLDYAWDWVRAVFLAQKKPFKTD